MSTEETSRSVLGVAAADARPRGGRLSVILDAIANDSSRERISIAHLFEMMRDRAFGALMFIFAVPNVLPLPPGASTVLGLPLIFLATQLALARPTPWLPKFMADRSMSRADFAATVGRASPWLAKAERLLKPRLSYLTRPPFEQAIGLACLLLAVILFLPIPFGNMPPALAICLFSLAILERDGIAAILGTVAAIVSVAIVWTVLYALIKSAIFILSNALASLIVREALQVSCSRLHDTTDDFDEATPLPAAIDRRVRRQQH